MESEFNLYQALMNQLKTKILELETHCEMVQRDNEKLADNLAKKREICRELGS